MTNALSGTTNGRFCASTRQDPVTEDELAPVVALPPLVRPDEEVPVEVLEHGEWWPGFADAWRGDRVSVRYRKGVGMTHLGWFPADHVRRV